MHLPFISEVLVEMTLEKQMELARSCEYDLVAGHLEPQTRTYASHYAKPVPDIC